MSNGEIVVVGRSKRDSPGAEKVPVNTGDPKSFGLFCISSISGDILSGRGSENRVRDIRGSGWFEAYIP